MTDVAIKTSTYPQTGVRDEADLTVKVQQGASSHAIVGALTETVAASAFTDGGSTSGTYALLGVLPAGAIVIGTRVTVAAGFAGNVSATLQIGDGSTVARYNTSTVNVFATAANGVESGVPSGSKLQVAAVNPVLTVTGSSDFTPILSGGGSLTVTIFYLPTA